MVFPILGMGLNCYSCNISKAKGITMGLQVLTGSILKYIGIFIVEKFHNEKIKLIFVIVISPLFLDSFQVFINSI